MSAEIKVWRAIWGKASWCATVLHSQVCLKEMMAYYRSLSVTECEAVTADHTQWDHCARSWAHRAENTTSMEHTANYFWEELYKNSYAKLERCLSQMDIWSQTEEDWLMGNALLRETDTMKWERFFSHLLPFQKPNYYTNILFLYYCFSCD